jgi:hypothetical protein
MKRIVFCGGLAAFLLVSSVALARFDESRKDAACARIQLAEAFGEPVSPKDKAQCMSQPEAKRRPAIKSGEDSFTEMPAEAFAKFEEAPVQTRPSWLNGKVAQGDVVFGVGMVQDKEVQESGRMLLAMQRALTQIAAQIQVQISSELTSDVTRTASRPRGGKRSKETSVAFETISAQAYIITAESIEDTRLVETYRDSSKKAFYLLASLDLSKVAQKEAAVVDAVFRSLGYSASEAAQAFGDDQFSQDALLQILDTLDQVNAISKSKLGRKLKDSWQTEYNELLRLAKLMVSCLEVDGGYAAENHRVVTFTPTCRGRAIRHGRFSYKVHGGLVDLPEILTTNRDGVGDVKVGATYGVDTIKLVLAHDISTSKGAYLVKGVKTGQGAQLELEATARPTASVHVSGLELTVLGEMGLAGAVEAWLSRKWGAEVVWSGEGNLKVTATFNLHQASEVYGKVIAPVELSIKVNGPRGVLFENTGRHAGQGTTERAAREQAYRNIVRVMSKW